jgi:hypothetical protein
MSDFDRGVKAAKTSGADVIVAPFNDPIGHDARSSSSPEVLKPTSTGTLQLRPTH